MVVTYINHTYHQSTHNPSCRIFKLLQILKHQNSKVQCKEGVDRSGRGHSPYLPSDLPALRPLRIVETNNGHQSQFWCPVCLSWGILEFGGQERFEKVASLKPPS
jgi:hypothetical protein